MIEAQLFKGKAIVIYGSRQTGKTTLVNMIREKRADSVYLNCDEIDIRQRLTNKTSTELASLVAGRKLVIIDEAQRVENIGLTLKLLVEHFKETQIIATGSSAFELSDKIKESLAGRAFEFHLYPFSLRELGQTHETHELERLFGERMVYGMYPEVVRSGDPKILRQLADSYLYKDILSYQNIKSHDILIRLLQTLALQIGNQVSYQEVGETVGIDKKTVEHYITILEHAFIVFRLRPFARNLRNEIKKLRKIYFYDLGIRNALINNFNPPEIRQDAGMLFENFMIAERIKRNENRGERKNLYFWRTHQKQEIDYLEEEGGRLQGYEIKLSKEVSKAGKAFLKAYPGSSVEVINKNNCLSFCL